MKTLALRVITWILFVGVLAACGSGGRGTVTLTSRLEGAVVYSSVLYVAGNAQGVEGLRFQLVSADGRLLAETTLQPVAETWSIELVHGYSGDPMPVTVSIWPLVSDGQAAYTMANLTLAALEHRPEGAFAYVVTPQQGDSMGGDLIMVSGRASGQTSYAITVTLADSSGTVLDSQNDSFETPYPQDELGWQVALNPREYVGEAVLTVDYGGGQSERITITLSAAAG